MGLPNISTYIGRFICGLLVLAPLYSLYQIANHIPILTPRTLPTLFIDRWMPFLPWTAWAYVVMANGVLLLILVRDSNIYCRAVLACAISFIINSCFWFLYPTIIERPSVPPASFANFAYHMTILMDTPANCLPSGHFTVPMIACWALVRDRPAIRWIAWPLFIACSITVLTTKQHYFVDVPAGIVVGLFSLYLARRITRSRRFHNWSDRLSSKRSRPTR